MTNLPDYTVRGKGEEGASVVQYGLLLGVVALVCVAAMSLLGTQISNVFFTLSGSV
jgi:Flp pilus assembly pilin Flp